MTSTTYKRSPHDEGGNLILAPGRWFVDTMEEDYLGAVDDLSEYIPAEWHREVVGSGGRGFIMVSFAIPEETRIPNEVAKELGFFYELPEGHSLADASESIYGSGFTEPVGFFEWLGTNHPSVLDSIKRGAETVVETTERVGENYKQTILWLFGGVAVLGLGALLLKKATK